MFDLSSSIADYGAQRTLSMGGSLTRYINTGSAYPTCKCCKAKKDEYVGKKSKKRFDKFITAVVLTTAGALAIFGLNKHNPKLFEPLKKSLAKVPNKLSDGIANGYNKVTEFFKNLAGKIKKPKA